jgi:mRNA interferase RelE/StbE
VAYTILIVPEAQKQLDKLPNRFRRQLQQKMMRLVDDPVPPDAKALKGRQFEGLYRVRSGDYRIVYQVRHQEVTVVVVRIGDRKDIYQ